MSTEKARLDADGTAQPKTRIVHHPPASGCVGPGMPLHAPEYEDEKGHRTPLTGGFRCQCPNFVENGQCGHVLAIARKEGSCTRPHVIRNGKADRPGTGLYGRLTGEELQAALVAHRSRLRARFDAAEYRLIAGRALLKAAETEAEADGWPDDAMAAIETERESVRSAERNVDAARAACERAGVIVNAHPATSIL